MVVSTAILGIVLFLPAVSTFVLSSRANIRVSALIKCFLLVSCPINSSKSSVHVWLTTVGSQIRRLLSRRRYFFPAGTLQVPY